MESWRPRLICNDGYDPIYLECSVVLPLHSKIFTVGYHHSVLSAELHANRIASALVNFILWKYLGSFMPSTKQWFHPGTLLHDVYNTHKHTAYSLLMTYHIQGYFP